jgi:hypothetical protein
MISPVPVEQLLQRGIHRLPVTGNSGEIVLIAVTSQHHMTPSSPYAIPVDSDADAAVDWLEMELCRIDPEGSRSPRHLTLV